ncbi:alpha,alpha-trehalose-phosphate synthase [candidate division MSBL1 archaeon SCGC-AAA259I09]|uniref:Alpha,alpha-trehalose-phosphate synthase n=1 Tax=candidate division MSBL1 archaeon SCGC-AAA259I09 TaxID=1698267 RepID=A0A133URN3_9EURY|nr:alpha,alpha-trehalose-phosphate synthase [candidate division MSBL1 archaeon SCGC-AAA259I09]
MDSEDYNLILVSNAEPYAHRRKGEEIEQEKLAGGLTSALDPLMQKIDGVWIAWGRENADFEVLNSEGKVRVPDENGYELKRLKLTEKEVDGFYLGFSNEILWPICHSFPERSSLSNYRSCEKKWEIYSDVNRKYADMVLEELEGNDLIWIHDYHLSLVPRMIRKENTEANISTFWHIPWPPWEIFGSLPWREEIIEGLVASDFLGFHTPTIKENFFSCARNIGMNIIEEKSLVNRKGSETRVASIPLGIDYNWFNSLSNKDKYNKKAEKLRKRIPGQKIIVGIDRLDYTKGIPERLRAFELFLEENPEFQGEVTLVQRIPPSRSSVKEYQSILNQINRLVGEINGKFEKADWTPIKSFHRFLSKQEQLIPYYMIADVGLVTPLIDGMNLVSKEFIACTDDGVLVLSEFAGAAEELKEAIQVNPYNVRETAQGIKKALTMTPRERKERITQLKKRVKENDLGKWREKFIKNWLRDSPKRNFSL